MRRSWHRMPSVVHLLLIAAVLAALASAGLVLTPLPRSAPWDHSIVFKQSWFEQDALSALALGAVPPAIALLPLLPRLVSGSRRGRAWEILQACSFSLAAFGIGTITMLFSAGGLIGFLYLPSLLVLLFAFARW